MAIVAGVDFGTLGLRVSIVDSERGLLDSAAVKYRCIVNETIQSMRRSGMTITCVLWRARRARRSEGGYLGDQIVAIALDTTSSSVIPVGQDLWPLEEI